MPMWAAWYSMRLSRHGSSSLLLAIAKSHIINVDAELESKPESVAEIFQEIDFIECPEADTPIF